MPKYVLNSPKAISKAADKADKKANAEPNQNSYNAGWLHGYAQALKETSVQLEPLQEDLGKALDILGAYHFSRDLYESLCKKLGMKPEKKQVLEKRIDPTQPKEPEKQENTKFSYTYRDGANYKTSYEWILAGRISGEQIEAVIDASDYEHFTPSLIGLPGGMFEGDEGYDPEFDHPMCEHDFEDSFEPTSAAPSGSMTVDEFVKAFCACKGKWETISREEVLAAVSFGPSVGDDVKVFHCTEAGIARYSEAIKYWSNSLGELHHHGQYDITEEELPAELKRAYHELWDDNTGSLCYLVETGKGYGIALINEYDECFAGDCGLTMEELFRSSVKDAQTIIADPAFAKAEIYLGKYMGFNECHELAVVFPADISAEEFRKAAESLNDIAYSTASGMEKKSFD